MSNYSVFNKIQDKFSKTMHKARDKRFRRKHDGLPLEAIVSLPYEEGTKLLRSSAPVAHAAMDMKDKLKHLRDTNRYTVVKVKDCDYILAKFEKNLPVLMPGYRLERTQPSETDCRVATLYPNHGGASHELYVYIYPTMTEWLYMNVLNATDAVGGAVVIGGVDPNASFEVDASRVKIIDDEVVDDLGFYYEYFMNGDKSVS